MENSSAKKAILDFCNCWFVKKFLLPKFCGWLLPDHSSTRDDALFIMGGSSRRNEPEYYHELLLKSPILPSLARIINAGRIIRRTPVTLLYDATRFLRFGRASHLFGVDDQLRSGGSRRSVRFDTVRPNAIRHSGIQIGRLSFRTRHRRALGSGRPIEFDLFPFQFVLGNRRHRFEFYRNRSLCLNAEEAVGRKKDFVLDRENTGCTRIHSLLWTTGKTQALVACGVLRFLVNASSISDTI